MPNLTSTDGRLAIRALARILKTGIYIKLPVGVQPPYTLKLCSVELALWPLLTLAIG